MTDLLRAFEDIDKLEAKLRTLEAIRKAAEPGESHICFAGDCSHTYTTECFGELRKWAKGITVALEAAEAAEAIMDGTKQQETT